MSGEEEGRAPGKIEKRGEKKGEKRGEKRIEEEKNQEERGREKPKTHIPACQLPNPLIASACAAVMVIRFSVSARLADNLAS